MVRPTSTNWRRFAGVVTKRRPERRRWILFSLLTATLTLAGCEPPGSFLKLRAGDDNLKAVYNVIGRDVTPTGDTSFHLGQRPVQIPLEWHARKEAAADVTDNVTATDPGGPTGT
jgi:hypothetical protein